MTDTKVVSYYRWAVEGKPIAVLLNLDLLDRLEREVLDSFKAITRRGSEIGGVLGGYVIAGNPVTVVIERFEAVECDYSRGPLYLLSAADKARMKQAVARVAGDGMSVAGLFRSNTRRELVLDDEDWALANEFFSGPDQICMLVRPFAAKPSAAAIFFWENGELAETSYREFPFKRSALEENFEEFLLDAPAPPAIAKREERPAAPPVMAKREQRPAASPVVAVKREEPEPAPVRQAPPMPKLEERPAASPVMAKREERPAAPPVMVKREERPAAPPVMVKREERPAAPPVMVKREERPAAPPVMAKREERPAAPPVMVKREERPAAPPVMVKREERPAAPPVMAKREERPAAPPVMAKREERPAAPPVMVKREERPAAPPVMPKREERPAAPPVMPKREERPAAPAVMPKREEPKPAAPPTMHNPATPPLVAVEPAPAAPAELVAAAAATAKRPAAFGLLKSAAIALVLVLGAGVGYRTLVRPAGLAARPAKVAENSLGLKVDNDAGRLFLSWNRNAPLISSAARATLTIEDGDHREDVNLDMVTLHNGSVVYSPISDDTSFRLEVADQSGASEAAQVRRLAGRAFGAAAAPAPQANALPAPGAGQEVAPLGQQPSAAVAAPAAEGAQPAKQFSLSARLEAASPAQIPEAPALESQSNAFAGNAPNVPGTSSALAPPPPAPAVAQASKAAAPAPVAAPATRVGTVAETARLLKQFPVAYPAVAKRWHVGGSVRVRAVIGKDGKVKKATAISGPPVLRPAAEESVMKWIYSPAILDGAPVQAEAQVDVSFGGGR